MPLSNDRGVIRGSTLFYNSKTFNGVARAGILVAFPPACRKVHFTPVFRPTLTADDVGSLSEIRSATSLCRSFVNVL